MSHFLCLRIVFSFILIVSFLFPSSVWGRVVFLPKGRLFYPPIADPKQPRFFLGTRYYKTPSQHFLAGVAGFGEEFGLIRWPQADSETEPDAAPPLDLHSSEAEGLQLSLDGGLSSQFNFQSLSTDLINADYSGGIPISWRWGSFSALLKPYHQSSHLGDEFLLTTQVERINLSYESLQFLVSQEWGEFRLYGGGEFLMRRQPADLERWILQGGGEWVRRGILFWKARPFLAFDLKSYEEHNFFANTSLKGGLDFSGDEIGRGGARHLRVMVESYYGYSPHGQFYTEKIFFAGLGLSFGF